VPGHVAAEATYPGRCRARRAGAGHPGCSGSSTGCRCPATDRAGRAQAAPAGALRRCSSRSCAWRRCSSSGRRQRRRRAGPSRPTTAAPAAWPQGLGGGPERPPADFPGWPCTRRAIARRAGWARARAGGSRDRLSLTPAALTA
jgi:hypothetical protein